VFLKYAKQIDHSIHGFVGPRRDEMYRIEILNSYSAPKERNVRCLQRHIALLRSAVALSAAPAINIWPLGGQEMLFEL
jgi:hypothetical protein